MKVPGAAPCQCQTPGSVTTASPFRISSTGPPRCWTRPTPSTTCSTWPTGWLGLWAWLLPVRASRRASLARSGCLRCAMDGHRAAGHPGAARVQGQVALAAGGRTRVVGPEALPAGGTARGDARPSLQSRLELEGGFLAFLVVAASLAAILVPSCG